MMQGRSEREGWVASAGGWESGVSGRRYRGRGRGRGGCDGYVLRDGLHPSLEHVERGHYTTKSRFISAILILILIPVLQEVSKNSLKEAVITAPVVLANNFVPKVDTFPFPFPFPDPDPDPGWTSMLGPTGRSWTSRTGVEGEDMVYAPYNLL